MTRKTLEIKYYGCEVLKQISLPVTDLTPEINIFIEDLINTMYENEGVGIAAPQVGVLKRIFICDFQYSETNIRKPLILINPEILDFKEEQESDEGCLSIPDVFSKVNRFKYIKMKYLDLNMKEQIIEANDINATILQHELDHLNGILFIDKLNSIKKMSVAFKLNKIQLIGQKMNPSLVYIEND